MYGARLPGRPCECINPDSCIPDTCDSGTCAPAGACCDQSNGDCQDHVAESTCNADGGSYQGDNTDCSDPLIDEDQDGVCNSSDVCPGSDDNIDTDGDGVPDCVELRAGGLLGSYYPSLDFTGTPMVRVDAGIDFDWGTGEPFPGFGGDNFTVRWTGDVATKSAGTYTFTTRTDDGVRLWVDSESLIDNWTTHAPQDESATIDLAAGTEYAITMEYFELSIGAVAQLRWTPPGGKDLVIPAANLIPNHDCDTNGVPDDCDPDADCNNNNTPDECETDSDGDLVIDDCDACPLEPALVNPSEVPEGTCDDGIDNDCDGDTDVVDSDCPEPCPGDGDCCTPHLTVGCSDAQCCATVCSMDSYCCNGDWDGFCVQAAAEFCGICPVGACCSGARSAMPAPDGSQMSAERRARLAGSRGDRGVYNCWETTPGNCDAEGDYYLGDGSACSGVDSDGDQVDDVCESCSTNCGDLDGSGFVDLNDYATFATCFNLNFPALDCDVIEFACCDMTGNGRVDLDDFATFAVMYATVPTTTVPNCIP